MEIPKSWEIYLPNNFNNFTDLPTSLKIIQRLGQVANEFFKFKNDGEKEPITRQTRLVKFKLAGLGCELEKNVWTNRLTSEHYQALSKLKYHYGGREWMFDVHWYLDEPNTNYMPKELSLVAEIEWGNKRPGDGSKEPHSDVKFDFQKLLITNAKLRLMIFSLSGSNAEKDLFNLDSYFTKAIKTYPHLNIGDEFLFACYYRNSSNLIYSTKNKQPELRF